MAYIDKIYGTEAQYWDLWTFCYERRPSLLAYFRPSHVTDKRPNEERTICNLPVRADMWLWANCPIEWLRARLVEQYGEAGPPEWCSTKPIRKRYGHKHAFQPPARPISYLASHRHSIGQGETGAKRTRRNRRFFVGFI